MKCLKFLLWITVAAGFIGLASLPLQAREGHIILQTTLLPRTVPNGRVVVSVFPGTVNLIAYRFVNQEQSNSGDSSDTQATRVTVGSTSGTPGASVVVPIYFTPADGVQVGTLKIVIKYVSANLKFSKVDMGIAAEVGGVLLSTEANDGNNDAGIDTQTVGVSAGFPPSQKSENGIPPSLLGYLNMRIDEDGRPASITLNVTANATELGTDKALEHLRISNGTVEVIAPGGEPAVNCFFFSH